ncbi:hypothetical protein KVV02_003313 [Mortierella alpina]|uniref:Fluoride export protein 1 n=1 Tax=Mortierella alpina TaxID=64518 RepID=A0A9P8CVU5_MORAP|nr:hypothetical protein KVV02_003313 [Mortierella alpina]
MQVFFPGFKGKSKSIDMKDRLTLNDFLVAAQEALDFATLEEASSFRYADSNKVLDIEHESVFETQKHRITNNCVIVVMVRLFGGNTLSETLDTIAKQELYVELEKVPLSAKSCTICLEEKIPCLKVCCTWMCKQDFANWFVAQNINVSCTLCRTPIKPKNFFKTREYIGTLQALEDEKQLNAEAPPSLGATRPHCSRAQLQMDSITVAKATLNHDVLHTAAPIDRPHLRTRPSSTHSSSHCSARSLQIEEGAELPPPLDDDEECSRTSDSRPPHPLLPSRGPIILPALIIPFSILGLLTRLGLVSIETFSGQQVFALAWPQFVGCFLMGLFVSTRIWIDNGFARINGALEDRSRIVGRGHWIGPFVYVGLSSGLCGSITTFSSWTFALFIELINPAKISRHPLQNILSAFAELIVTLALSVSGLQLGCHLGEALLPSLLASKQRRPEAAHNTALSQASNAGVALVNKASITDNTSSTVVPPLIPLPPKRWTIFDIALVSACLCLWIGMILAAIFIPPASQSSWRHVVLATCFSPPGAILRWYLSRFNRRLKDFPVGTFAANILGSVVLAALVCLQHSPTIGGKSAFVCQILSGLQDGFCGCLTTISTFALELKSLPRRASYIYGLASVVIAQLLMLLILGSFVWTRSSSSSDTKSYTHSICQM